MSKEKLNVARIEAVQRLHTMANQLEEGTVRLGDKSFKVPDRVSLEIKAESGELEFELKWKGAPKEEQKRSEEPARHA